MSLKVPPLSVIASGNKSRRDAVEGGKTYKGNHGIKHVLLDGGIGFSPSARQEFMFRV
jgi:hypothetical protein